MEENKTKESFSKKELEEILQEIYDQEHLSNVYDTILEISSKYGLNLHKPEENDYENEEPIIEDISKLDTDLDLDELIDNENDF